MLKIRTGQMDSLKAYARANYRHQLVTDLRDHYPHDFSLLGDDNATAAIHAACDNANRLGFHAKADVRKFVILALMLGTYFDRDPLLPWASVIISNPDLLHPAVKIHALSCAAERYLVQTAGVNGEHYSAALSCAAALPFDRLVGWSSGACATPLESLLKHCYRPQFEAISDTDLRRFRVRLENTIDKHGLNDHAGMMVTGLVMFLTNSLFACDPLHGWARPAVQTTGDAATKAQSLWHSAVAFLSRNPAYRLHS